MTVLYSCYVPEGIIFAADTMLTVKDGGKTKFYASKDPKVFPVPGLGDHPSGGLIGYFGNALVKRRPMAEWLRETIGRYPPSRDTSTFPVYLIRSLEAAAYKTQLTSVQGFHVGAFERRGGYRVPVFWFIRNAQVAERPGGVEYQEFPGWKFHWDEQLLGDWLTGVSNAEVLERIKDFVRRSGTPIWFRNGDLYAFGAAGNAVDAAATAMVNQAGTGYRVPRSLNRWTQLAKTYVRLSSELAQIYYSRGTPTIGGDALAERIPWQGRP